MSNLYQLPFLIGSAVLREHQKLYEIASNIGPERLGCEIPAAYKFITD